MKSINNFVEKHYSKLLGVSLSIFALSLIAFSFTVGTSVSGKLSSWEDDVIHKADVSINNTGQETVDELLSREIVIGSPAELDSYIKEQEALLNQLLTEYYEAKAKGVTGEADLEKLKEKIRNIRTNMLTHYKKVIDEEFVKYNLS